MLAPTVRAAEALTQPSPTLHRRIIGTAVTLAHIDLFTIAADLADARACALDGRPRGESSGRGGGGATSTTEDVGTELWRIRDIGLQLDEAIDKLHPDPSWPTISSGLRERTACATEHVLAAAAACFATLNPERAYDDLADAVDGLCVAATEVRRLATIAAKTRAWRATPESVDPPDDTLEAARCTSWPLGMDRNGKPARCGNYRGEHGHRHPITGSAHHDDLCDDCYRMVCPQCWSRVRRTPNARDCMACEIRTRRGRAA